MTFIDIGANLTNKAFRDDMAAVLARSKTAGVHHIVVTGTSGPASRQAWEVAAKHDSEDVRLWSTAGVHPHHASTWSKEIEEDVRDLLRHPRVVAVGECGLDYNRNFSPPAAQREAFEAQLALAADVRKPVFLHERDAHEDFFRILERWRPRLVGAVVHCFTGDRAALDAYLALDVHIGLTGWICDERRGKHLEELVRLIPQGRLMIETDAPYIKPRNAPSIPHSDARRNEPFYLAHIAKTIARCRGETVEALARHSTEAARAFFRMAPDDP